MSTIHAAAVRWLAHAGLATLCAAGIAGAVKVAPAADALPNACPVDGCTVKIIAVKRSGDELQLTLEANYSPDISKNHIHVWRGDTFTADHASNDPETANRVKQGEGHPMAD